MISSTFILLLYLKGYFFSLYFAPKLDKKYIHLTSLAVGSLLYALIFSLILSFYRGGNLVYCSLLSSFVLTLYFAYFTVSKVDIKMLVSSIVFILSSLWVLSKANIIIMSADSFWIVHFSKNLANGDFEFGSVVLSMWGVFLASIHSVTLISDDYILSDYHQIISINLVAFFVYSLHSFYKAFGFFENKRKLFILSTVSLLAASNLFIYHFFVVHTAMISALFFLIFVVSWINYDLYKDKTYILYSFIAIMAIGLLRIETPIVGFFLLCAMCSSCRLSWRDSRAYLLTYCFIFLFWYSRLYFYIPEEHDLLEPKHILMVIAFFAISSLLAYSLRFNLINKLFSNFSQLILILLVVMCLIMIIVMPGHMLLSLLHIIQNLLISGGWGITWVYALALTFYLMFNTKPIKQFLPILITSGIFLLFVYLVVATRIPYRLGPGDSANRMIVHVYPLLVMYLAFWLMQLFQKERHN